MIKDVRNVIFDADDALRDGDIDRARALLVRADVLLIAIQQGLQGDKVGLPDYVFHEPMPKGFRGAPGTIL